MIWIVTDDAVTGEELTRWIQKHGYTVTTMDCAADVPSRVRFREPKVVIVDCGLEKSFQIVQQIRSEAGSRKVALIMFALSDRDFRSKALAAGADAFVTRGSLDWAELLTELQKFAGPPGENR